MNRLRLRILPLILLVSAACTSSVQPARYKIALVPSGRGQHGIFVMNADSSGGKLLTSDAGAELRPDSWSPDGSRIAYFSTRGEDAGLMSLYQIPGHHPLYLMDATGAGQRRLFNFPVSSFGWSPDGKKLFFISAYEDPEHDQSAIYCLDLDTGDQRRITAFGKDCAADWSPDGTRLAISLGENTFSDIYVTTLDAHGRRLTDSQTTSVRPVWSPDGKQIAYTVLPSSGTDAKQAGIYLVNSDGRGRRRLTDISTYGVCWSPDGQSILLQAVGAVYLVDVNTGNPVRVRVPTDSLLDPVFTPDGKEIMFRSNYEGDWNLYAVDLKSNKCRRLTEQISAFMFSLSPLLH